MCHHADRSGNSSFGNVVDGMIVVDLLRTEPRTLHKYMGRAQADAYLAHDRSISARVTA